MVAGSTDDEVLRVTAGLFTYYIPAITKTLAVMWTSSPLCGNAWNVKLYDNDRTADLDMYWELIADSFPGDTQKYKKKLGADLKCKGSMSSGGDATLAIQVD